MGSKNCLSKIIADVYPPWHCANVHLNARKQYTVQTSAFIMVVILAEDQVITDRWHLAAAYLFSSSGCTKGVFSKHHFCIFDEKKNVMTNCNCLVLLIAVIAFI